MSHPSRHALRVAAASVLAWGVSACEPAPPPEPFDVVEATIAGIQEAIHDGRTTCVAVVQAYLDRIEAYDSVRGIHAITEVNPAALDRASELDRELAEGRDPGPLFCAPILVKDNFDTHDLPTTGGSIALAGSLPPDDAFMVRRIRQAGAIVLAKTNMAEWAFSPRETVSSSYGTTANAYAPDRVPAGSSGGTASGVAASFGVAGLGSDTGNSIRGPSSHLALFGIRSTIGLTSRDGVIPLAFDRDIAGPMTRTVEDGARLFDVVAGYDPADPYTELGRGHRAADYTAFLDADGLRGARLGVLRALVDPASTDSAVAAVFERALADLQRLGAELVDPFEVPGLDGHLDAEGLFCGGFRHDVGRYLASLGDAPPLRDVLDVLEDGRFHERSRGALEFFAGGPLDVAPPDQDPPCPAYAEHPGRQAFLADVVSAMDEAEVEAVVYPTWTHPPAHLDRATEEYRGDNSQLVAPATGMPAATVPMGYTYGELPAGLQLLARPYDEGVLFRLAYAYEQGTVHRRPPDGFPRLEAAGSGS
ncbi:MAG TPA: amidase family protein [Longimicrobiales bacterium]|nr:amidase family protein [Longimicrobiales bacterium]